MGELSKGLRVGSGLRSPGDTGGPVPLLRHRTGPVLCWGRTRKEATTSRGQEGGGRFYLGSQKASQRG